MEISQQAFVRAPRGAHRVVALLGMFLALLPLTLFIYLGSHSRLKADDFCHLTAGLEYGPWDNVLFWRDSLNGSYSWYFLHGLAAPLDELAPSAFVVIIIAALLIGLVWLMDAGRRLAGLQSPTRAQVIVLGATLAALSINALLNPLPIYWFSASARHTLPIAVLLIALAAGCELIPRIQSLRWLAAACALFTLLAFANAGIAETFVVLQLALLMSLLPIAYIMPGKNARRNGLAFIIAGCLATGASLLVMMTAPGFARRLDMIEGRYKLPPRSLAELLPEYLEHIQFFLMDTKMSAAFVGMLALCLFLILAVQRPGKTPPIPKPFHLAAPPLLFGALAQLLLLPLLWSQQSDNPNLFARPAFTVIIGIQMLLPLCLAAIILARRRINAILLNKREYWALIPALTLAVVFLLFSLIQYPGIDWRAALIFTYSIHLLLLVLLWQLHSHLKTTGKARFFIALALIFLVICASVLALVVVNETLLGKRKLYTLPFVPFGFSLAGFISGIALAFGINQANASSPAIRPLRAIQIGSAIIVIAIWFSMMQENAQSIPRFENFARTWDERHQIILARRDEGERLETTPLQSEMEKYSILAGYFAGAPSDYWHSACGSDEITALLERRYRA